MTKRLLIAAAVLLLVIAAGAFGTWRWVEGKVATPLAAPGAARVVFEVPKGATGRSIGGLLVQQQLIRDTRLWRFYLWQHHGMEVKAGRFELSPSMAIPEIAHVLEGAPLPEDQPFAMIEGWRIRDADAALAEKKWIQPGAYISAASHPERFHVDFPLDGSKTLEGYLYPETYRVVPDPLDVDALIQRQLETFQERFWVPYKDEIAKSGRTLRQLVIMASLLEREEPHPDQRPLVAGILWKRIDKGYPLGVDATSRYLLDEWNDRTAFLQRLHDKSDPWNSRVHPGLPPGPIGAPSLESLVAALRPKKSDFWYYLHDANKVIHPSRNAAEHEALRAKYGVH